MRRSLQCLQCLHCRRRAPSLPPPLTGRYGGPAAGAAGGVAAGPGGDCAGSGPALRGFIMQRQDAGSAAAPRPPPDPF